MRIFEEDRLQEDVNRAEIALYPEGLFYKAYERSAFAFVTRISAFKPSKETDQVPRPRHRVDRLSGPVI